MKRLGFFTFFSFLLSMCFLCIVDDDGAGGDDPDLDTDLDDDDKEEDKKGAQEKKPDAKPPSKDDAPDPDKMLLEEIRQERVLNSITKEMKVQYGDGFDMGKVVDKLKEMEAKEPGSGNKLFNKAGIELMHLKHFNHYGSDNEFDGTSGRGGKPISTDELIGKINKGEASDDERKAFFAKYA